ncbi:MAG: hypothetical protein IT374_26615 [Polyangiaceae bacterium]|nr:hypothetical protein [Polyangiaceae bacterium]
MTGRIECKRCGFDLALLPAELRMDPKMGGVRSLTCPLCRSSVVVRVQELGVLVRGSGAATSFARWSSPGASDQRPVVQVGPPGRFTLRFDTLGSIEPREVCYARVPAFVDEGGKLVVPPVPVRPEYFDVIDVPALKEQLARGPIGEVIGAQYQVTLPLRGLSTPVTVMLQLHLPEDGAPSKENAFREVNLRVWPNVKLSDWRYYLVGAASSGPLGDALLSERRLRVWVRAAADEEWVEVDQVQRQGTACSRVLGSRPAWVVMELVDPARADRAASLAGGMFAVPDATTTTSKETVVGMGLDFGTSNTCVALTGAMTKQQAGPELVPEVSETDWNLYLVRGGPESTAPAGPDLWPPPRGFGPRRDLFPSELLFSRNKRDTASGLAAVDGWRFGRDFGIPAAGVTPGYAEDEYTLGDFKWTDLLRQRASTYAPHTASLQAHYISTVLTLSYVRAAIASGQAARTVNVVYSYPMAFTDPDLQILRAGAHLAQTLLRDTTGLEWTIDEGADESTAAARNAGDPGANILVYLDMGGGSSDIGVKQEVRNEEWETVFLTSVAYAGGDLLSAFVGRAQPNGATPSSCLAGKTTIDVLRRRVRESTTAKEVLGDPTLFKATFSSVVEKRTRHFYGYLLEYVARLLAAGFLDQRFHCVGAEGKKEATIAFYFLGNGWRFSGVSGPGFETVLAQQVFDRMMELLKSERTEYAKGVRRSMPTPDRLRHVVGAMGRGGGVPHPKAAVALGVLAGQSRGQASMGEPRSGILGWTTKVDGAEIPWFVRYQQGAMPSSPGGTGPAASDWGDDDGLSPAAVAPRAQAPAGECLACGSSNPPKAKFCSSCAQPLAPAAPPAAPARRFCNECGTENVGTARFCCGCGASLGGGGAATPAPAPQRPEAPSSAASLATPWYKQIAPGARMDWSTEHMVVPDSLRQPARLDPDLNHTRATLRAQCKVGEGNWFNKGAYEVTLEALFKPKLGEIA